MKISNMIRQSTTVKLALGVLFATCVVTSVANAQSTFAGKVTLPYEVHWNHAVLPAGEYSIRMDSKGAPRSCIRPAQASQPTRRFRLLPTDRRALPS